VEGVISNGHSYSDWGCSFAIFHYFPFVISHLPLSSDTLGRLKRKMENEKWKMINAIVLLNVAYEIFNLAS
jgi:hypothetical protein